MVFFQDQKIIVNKNLAISSLLYFSNSKINIVISIKFVSPHTEALKWRYERNEVALVGLLANGMQTKGHKTQ